MIKQWHNIKTKFILNGLSFLALTIVVVSCSSTNERAENSLHKISKESIALFDSINTIGLHNSRLLLSYQIKLDTLLLSRNVLLKDFDEVPGHCGQPTYCHKNYWGGYAVRNHVLVCGVDTLGNEFLVANTYLPYLIPNDPYAGSEIVVQIEDSTFQTNCEVEAYTTICDSLASHNQLYLCACYPIIKFFPNGKENGLVKAIARHYTEPMDCYFKFEDGTEDHQLGISKKFGYAFKETAALAGLLKRISHLRTKMNELEN